MTASAMADTPGHAQPDDPGQVLQAEPGDTLVIDGAGIAGLPRTGTIIAVTGQDGTPPYLVHWTAGDYQSRITPGPGARIEKPAATALPRESLRRGQRTSRSDASARRGEQRARPAGQQHHPATPEPGDDPGPAGDDVIHLRIAARAGRACGSDLAVAVRCRAGLNHVTGGTFGP